MVITQLNLRSVKEEGLGKQRNSSSLKAHRCTLEMWFAGSGRLWGPLWVAQDSTWEICTRDGKHFAIAERTNLTSGRPQPPGTLPAKGLMAGSIASISEGNRRHADRGGLGAKREGKLPPTMRLAELGSGGPTGPICPVGSRARKSTVTSVDDIAWKGNKNTANADRRVQGAKRDGKQPSTVRISERDQTVQLGHFAPTDPG